MKYGEGFIGPVVAILIAAFALSACDKTKPLTDAIKEAFDNLEIEPPRDTVRPEPDLG